MAETLRELTVDERLYRLEHVVFELVQSVWDHLGTERCRELLEELTPTHVTEPVRTRSGQPDNHLNHD